MPALKISKVTSVPGVLTAHTLYLVAPTAHPGYLEVYVTDAAGAITRRTPTVDDIQAMIDASASGATTVVDNIAARNALPLVDGKTVLVVDATADATVASGAATYVYRLAATAWAKISEAESMDISLAWANIAGKPSSSPAAIDAAVAASHAHTNLTQLNQIGQDASGNLTYNGALPMAGFATANW